MTIAASSAPRTRLRPSSLCPWTATRPRRSWLVAISVLWSSIWLQFGVVDVSWNRRLALVLFGVACADTVAYGMTLRPRRVAGPSDPGVASSAGVGVLTLAAVSWTPLFVFGAFVSIGSMSIAPLVVLLIFGVPFALGLAVLGYLILLVLLGLGRAIDGARRASDRRRGASVARR